MVPFNEEGYEPLLGGVEVEAGSLDDTRPPHPDDLLLGHEEEPLDWAAVHNLDQFFTQCYRYWEERGFTAILISRLLNLAALLFTIVASGLLLLSIDYSAIHENPCLKTEKCTLWDVAVIQHPLRGPLTLWKSLSVLYLAIFSGYVLLLAVHFIHELRGLLEVRHFYSTTIGMSERALRAATWPEIAARLVSAQHTVRLCLSKDLIEHDIVSRIMRKDNYLIGMLNNGILALNVPLPGLRSHVLLTKTVEWNLRFCVLDSMLNESTFKIHQSFLRDEAALQKRFRQMAVVNAIISPFLFVFLIIYFFMKNAEALYRHPSSIFGARRWSPAAWWRIREYNELPHFINQRLHAGHVAATTYVAQFPNHAISHIARFVAFITGSFAAVLIALTLADERILEYDLAVGRQTLWWLGLLGIVLTVSRSLIIEPTVSAFNPEYALLEVAAHTHYYPRHWRGGRAHTLDVQEEFQTLFRYRVFLLFEELASVLLTPLILWYSLPPCAGAILQFVDRNTTYVEGIGDVFSQAAFENERHHDHDHNHNHQEEMKKMDQSLVSFSATYPTWVPPTEAEEFLNKLALFVENDAIGVRGDRELKVSFSDLLTTRYPHSAQYTYLQSQRNLLNYRLATHNNATTDWFTTPPPLLSLVEERIVAAQALLESYYEHQEEQREEERILPHSHQQHVVSFSPQQQHRKREHRNSGIAMTSELSVLSRDHSSEES